MLKQPHIIIVDDESMVRSLASKSLQAIGMQTSVAINGEEGLQLFMEGGADAILLDVMLPGMDGFAVCSTLRTLPNGEHIPVLMMTGLDDPASINHAFEAGATDFITKPLNISLLRHRVRYMLKANQTTLRLLESEERWKFALEGAGDSVWDWNPQTDEVLFSRRWQEITGCHEDEIPKTGMAWIESCHKDDRQSILEVLLRNIESSQPNFTVEFRVAAKDVPWKWILARGKLIKRDNQGKPLRVIGTLTDISETKSLQAQLNQAHKLEAIGQLASGIAHEINTPIQYIGGNLSTLGDYFLTITAYQQELTEFAGEAFKKLIDNLNNKYDLEFVLEDGQSAIQESRDGVERITEIVKAMNSFAHVGSNANAQNVDIHEAINNALIITSNTYKFHAEVKTNFDEKISLIECYRNELIQVFINMIVNSSHAIEEKKNPGGLISITTKKLQDYVEILIADNGIGISPENREKIFNLFFTTKEVGKGTGQGLNLSYSIIVEKHHGKLFFDSSPGVGTTFHIQLPFKQNKPKAV